MTEIRLSYSKLSDYDRNGARSLVDKVKDDTRATTIGSLVNDLLFENVDFKKKYHVKEYENPTSTTLKLANIIIQNYVEIPDGEEIIEIIQKNGLWSNTKKVEKLIEYYDKPEFWEYINLHMKDVDKLIVSPEMLLSAEELVSILKTHKFSRNYFNNRKTIISEISFQIKYNDASFRGIVDMIELDHEAKTFRIMDLKTGAGRHLDFTKSYIEWRYYLQEAIYMLAADEIKAQLGVSDYETLNFQFLYIGKSEKIPVVFDITEKWHNAALNGFQTGSGYRYKGLNQLIEEVKYHHHHKIYDIPYETIVNEGVLRLYDNIHEKE